MISRGLIHRFFSSSAKNPAQWCLLLLSNWTNAWQCLCPPFVLVSFSAEISQGPMNANRTELVLLQYAISLSTCLSLLSVKTQYGVCSACICTFRILDCAIFAVKSVESSLKEAKG